MSWELRAGEVYRGLSSTAWNEAGRWEPSEREEELLGGGDQSISCSPCHCGGANRRQWGAEHTEPRQWRKSTVGKLLK